MEEKKEIIAGSPLKVAGLTLIPVVETRLQHWRYRKSFSVFGSRQAICIIIITPTTKKAFKVTGEEVTLEELQDELPDLEKNLESL